MGFRFPDREETYEAGDAYYVPPGHTPVHYTGAEIVEFSPTEILGRDDPRRDEEPARRPGWRWGRVMNYRLAYAIGFHPWEDLAEHPPFADKLLELVAREEDGSGRPTGRRSTSGRAAGSGASGSRSEAGR